MGVIGAISVAIILAIGLIMVVWKLEPGLALKYVQKDKNPPSTGDD